MGHQLFLMHCLDISCLPHSPSNFRTFWSGDRWELSPLQGVQTFHTKGCSLNKTPRIFTMCFILKKIYSISPFSEILKTFSISLSIGLFLIFSCRWVDCRVRYPDHRLCLLTREFLLCQWAGPGMRRREEDWLCWVKPLPQGVEEGDIIFGVSHLHVF